MVNDLELLSDRFERLGLNFFPGLCVKNMNDISREDEAKAIGEFKSFLQTQSDEVVLSHIDHYGFLKDWR